MSSIPAYLIFKLSYTSFPHWDNQKKQYLKKPVYPGSVEELTWLCTGDRKAHSFCAFAEETYDIH